MKWILLCFFILSIFFTLHFPTSAVAKSQNSAFSASGQYIKYKNIVRTYFGNLKGISKVSYTLMYQENGVGQGVSGSFSPGKKTSFSKDLFLGTCSGKVCISHRNIKNVKLEVTSKYTNGKYSTKTIKIK